MTYKLVIFDCDGTLVDSEALNNQAVSEVLTSLGHLQYTNEYCMENFTGMSLTNLLAHINQDIKSPLSAEEILPQFKQLGSILARRHLKAVPEVHNVLKKLSHKKCVASNGERSSVLESLLITDLDKFFPDQHVFTRSQVKHGKPEPDLFLFAASQMEVHPNACLVIEDSATGIKAAKAAGMKVLGFTGASHNNLKNHQQLKDLMPDGIINQLSEIWNYL